MQVASLSRCSGPADDSTVYAASVDGFGAVHVRSTNVCVLRRSLPSALARLLDHLSGLEPFERKLSVGAPECPSLDALVAGIPEPLGRGLVLDMMQWVGVFLDVSRASNLAASLTLTQGDECRRFHVDWIELRLLLTYAGPGSEWVRNRDVDREATRKEWIDVASANAAIVRDPATILRAHAGDVLVLKGEAYPGNQGQGAVHRSPPIASSGAHRLVFKLTAPADYCESPAKRADPIAQARRF